MSFRQPYVFAILASLLLSFFAAYQESVINPDAICYLLSAQAIAATGIRGAMQLCGQAQWPFYSLLIYSIQKFSHLDITATAYLIDSVLTLISALAFILIVKELGGSGRILWFAAFTILLSHEFNSVRDYIVRDHGFWAFYLTSILLLLRYIKKPEMLRGFLWGASLLIATLFRIEGAFFLLALPFVCFFTRQGLKRFLMLNTCLLGSAILFASWLLLHPQASLSHFGRLQEISAQLQHGVVIMSQNYQLAKAVLIQHLLHAEGANQAGLIFFLILIAWYLISVIGNVSIIYALLAVYAWLQKTPANKNQHNAAMWVLGFYLLVNVIITFGFLAERLFLSKRYLLALSLTLMLWVPFAFDHLIRTRAKLITALVTFFIFISALGGIIDFGYSKLYIRQAGDWLSVHVPKNASLYSNDIQLKYYSKHFDEHIFNHDVAVTDGQWKQYDYLALRLNKKEGGAMAALLQSIPHVPLQIFSNKRGDRVVIYQLKMEIVP